MRKRQKVSDMAEEVLERQARKRVQRTGEPFEDAFEAVLATEAGRQLEELRDGPHGEERAQEWQKHIRRERAGAEEPAEDQEKPDERKRES